MKQHHSHILTYVLLILGILLIGLISFIYFWQQAKTSEYLFTYNGFRFQRDQYGYKILLYINDQDVPATIHLREDPRTLEDIPISCDIQLLRQKQQLYVVIDPIANLTSKATIGALEIDAIIDNPYLFNINVSSAFTQPYLNNTVKTCRDVTATQGIILLQTGDETVLRNEQDCIIIQGKTEDDIIRASDRLVYTLLNIMNCEIKKKDSFKTPVIILSIAFLLLFCLYLLFWKRKK